MAIISTKVSEEKRAKQWSISMTPEIIRLVDEKRGLLERSAWLRYLIVRELGLTQHPYYKKGLEAPIQS